MSKQYLAEHTIDDAHISDIFTLAVTPTQIISGSGSSAVKIHSSSGPDFQIEQVLQDADPHGVHHLATSSNHLRLVSSGFSGVVKVWKFEDGIWKLQTDLATGKKAGEVWAVALDAEGKYLAATTSDGRVTVWDLDSDNKQLTEWETKGSFGLCIDLSLDGQLAATGHESGAVFVFSTTTSRLIHSLPGLVRPIREVKFSPGSSLLAAAGDARIIALYDSKSGEQVANLTGHDAWILSLDWSSTGQYLLSGGHDGKVKVWDVERRTCVATHSESDKALWSVRWLPKPETGIARQKSERFVTGGSSKAISIYREAAGGG